MSNDILNELERRKKHEPMDQEYYDYWISTLTDDAEKRFSETDLDLSEALQVLDRWEEDDEKCEAAKLIRHHYVSEMSMKDIASELGLAFSTAYRKKTMALEALQHELGVQRKGKQSNE